MEYYEMFENVPEDFNIFKPGIWMYRQNPMDQARVPKEEIQKYLSEGWLPGMLSQDGKGGNV